MLLISLYRAFIFVLFYIAALSIYHSAYDMGPIVTGVIGFIGVTAYFFVSMWGESRIVDYFNPEDDNEQR